MDKTKNRTKFDEVNDISDFHKFHKSTYYPAALGYTRKQMKEQGINPSERMPVPLSLVKKIISTYFDIYFKELYFIRRPIYFLFSGYLQVVYTEEKYTNGKIKKKSLALFWGNRPSFLYAFYVSIIKLTGKLNKLPAIEKMCLKNNDITKFPKFDQTYKSKLWHRVD